MIKQNVHESIVCRSTESAIKRWLEYYGSVSKQTLKDFMGITDSSWYGTNRPQLRANLIEILKKLDRQKV